MAPTGARFRVWLRFLAISDLVATGWLRPVGSTPLESSSNFTFRRSTIWQSNLASERRMERKQMQP